MFTTQNEYFWWEAACLHCKPNTSGQQARSRSGRAGFTERPRMERRLRWAEAQRASASDLITQSSKRTPWKRQRFVIKTRSEYCCLLMFTAFFMLFYWCLLICTDYLDLQKKKNAPHYLDQCKTTPITRTYDKKNAHYLDQRKKTTITWTYEKKKKKKKKPLPGPTKKKKKKKKKKKTITWTYEKTKKANYLDQRKKKETITWTYEKTKKTLPGPTKKKTIAFMRCPNFWFPLISTVRRIRNHWKYVKSVEIIGNISGK